MLMDFSKKTFDILIQAGQSNAEGYGFGDTDDPFQPNNRTWYLNSDFTITPAAERIVGNDIQSDFSLSFSQRYIDEGLLKNEHELLILRCAVGGTGFTDQRWIPTGDLYRHMMEMIQTALSLNPNNRLVAFLWHQGETDACNHTSFDAHYAHLTELLRGVTTAFQVPNLPFIAGDMVPDWMHLNPDISTPVSDAIRSFCEERSTSRFVQSDGLTSNREQLTRPHPLGWGDTDTIHFSRTALYELGKRYFDAFISIQN